MESNLEKADQVLGILSEENAKSKTNAIIAYALMVLGLFTGVLWIVGAIWAMVKRGDAKGTLFEDHYTNIIQTFWWSFGLSVLGIVLAIFVVGYFIIVGVWFWSVFKVVKGLARITSDKPYSA